MNIAIFCPNWVGDAVMATPALRAIRRHFAEARITGVVRPAVAATLEGSPHLDDWVLYDPKGDDPGHRTLAAVGRLRKRRIDQAVLLTNSFRSALLSRMGGARRVLGYNRDGRGWLLTDKLPPLRRDGHYVPSPVIDYYLALAYRLGCRKESYRMQLWTSPDDERQADECWEEFGLSGHAPVVVLNPGAAFGSAKCWPTGHFAALAESLVQKRHARVMVLCGPAERDMAADIVRRCDTDRVVSLAERPVSIGLSKACVRRADLMVTTDSGPRHFAAAFDVPVVTLFGSTHIAWSETYYAKSVHVQRAVDCGPCQKRQCPTDHHCMQDLRPEEVYRAAASLLDSPSPAGDAKAAGASQTP